MNQSPTPSHWLRRAWQHPSFKIGATGTLAFLIAAIVSLVWTPYDVANLDIAGRFAGVSAAHWLGTDFFGRDMASLLMSGTQTSFMVALLAVGIGMGVGVPLGLAAAVYGGLPEQLVLRLSDFLFAFPAVISAIIVTTLLGPSAQTAMLAIGIFNIPVFARVTRGGARALMVLDYVGAARLAGLSLHAIAIRHLLPNIMSLIIVQATIQLSLGILAEAGLS